MVRVGKDLISPSWFSYVTLREGPPSMPQFPSVSHVDSIIPSSVSRLGFVRE